ncbi:hypothetical protein AMATHDRAFT_74896 [Amanita thiersii Skay4041]|uniref:Uncharacterized protein n=1 Tax=Amanita thiersii Skay4041 TaxID=703135 RepID=A0A2A9NTF3_9AGAR|nr:hypothetical protein AMATHDRAFT_74896 [Amanita thiersii Skay4041]
MDSLSSLPSYSSTHSTLVKKQSTDPVPAHHASPVVAFIIGLTIILLASILNAAGLNLTKLDHVRTSAIPKSARRKDWMRPLWLLGMLLYILSQLVGSTLALEYMRAEYVAPLGSSSLIFNFLFARFLVGTPVTNNDIYGTIIVVLGVIGIVAFGSINSGLASETSAARLTYLWQRGGWLGFFFAMTFALALLLVFTTRLEAVLNARNEVSPQPDNNSTQTLTVGASLWDRLGGFGRAVKTLKVGWKYLMIWITEKLELWTVSHPDKRIAWTLGIGWACCGGGLAGMCLVFAKASVKLISGSLSHTNTGNQLGRASSIFTFLLLAGTAVMQIICLNRGLKVYDSTLVVPVFYGVYTATGFLDSLIFNNEVDAYQSWTLFLIFCSILVLISGVVLLTHKKPEPGTDMVVKSATLPRPRRSRKKPTRPNGDVESLDAEEERTGERDVLWEVGEASDDELGEDEDIDHHQHPLQGGLGGVTSRSGEETIELIGVSDEDDRTTKIQRYAYASKNFR